jgi:lipopolysaccharide export system permease protein
MQREVRRGRAEYMEARKDFLEGMKEARDNKVKLGSDMYATDTHVPSNISLGATYCWLLRELRIPTLSAQGVPPAPSQSQIPQQPATQSTTKGQTAAPVQAGPAGSASMPQKAATPAPAPVPARIYTTPPPSAGMAVTPSTITVSRVRLSDAKTLIDGYEIEIHKKFALAVACFVFVMLGAPIALRFPRGGVGLTLGVSLFVFALYYIGLTAGAAAASQGLLPPVIAMWAANVIFAAVAVALLWRMGKEGATTRGGDMREMLSNVRGWLKQRMRAVHLMRERRAEP